MKIKYLCLFTILIFAITFSFFGCGSDSDGGGGLKSATYSGADPKGDFIAVEIDGSAKTVTHYNYTTSETHGPYDYSKVTDSDINGGFSNMYITEELYDEPAPDLYAAFVIVNGVAIIYQLMDSDNHPVETPGYAFVRQDMDDLSAFEGTAYNWIKFHMLSDEGNFEAGFAGWDTAGNGLLYGACYNSRADKANAAVPYDDYDVNGIKNINDTGTLDLGDFVHDATNMSHYYAANTLTFIPNQNGDCVIDFGPNNGAGYAIRQADTKEWQSAYNGTYFMMVYHNDSDGSAAQTVEPMKLVLSTSTTDSNNGHFKAYNHGSSDLELEGDFIPLEDLPDTSSPGGGTAINEQFETISGCAAATSTVVKNAYKAHGGFVAQPTDKVIFGMMDPSGNYLFFTMFSDNGGGDYDYAFGFGVK